MFLHLSVILFTVGMCMAERGMYGRWECEVEGVCMVGGHV